MPWTDDFRAGHVSKQFEGDISPINLGSITQITINANPQVTKETTSGNVFPDEVRLESVAPVASFTTLDVEGALKAFGVNGICIDGDTEQGLWLYAQRQDCSGVATGNVHDVYKVKQGVLVPRSLTVQHRANASITYDIFASYDGTNNPVVKSSAVALPVVTPNGRWKMYSMSIDNLAEILGKRSIEIQFNPTVTQEGADSTQFNTVVHLATIHPQIVVRGVDTGWFTTVSTLLGEIATHANTVIALQKRGSVIGNSDHIKLSAYGLINWDTIFEGTPDSPASNTFRIDCALDSAANAPIGVTTETILP